MGITFYPAPSTGGGGGTTYVNLTGSASPTGTLDVSGTFRTNGPALITGSMNISGTLNLNGSMTLKVRTVTSDYTIKVNDDYIVHGQSGASTLTITLPLISAVPVGRIFVVKRVGNGAGTVRVSTTSPNTLEVGTSTFDLLGQAETATFYSDGTYWYVGAYLAL